MSILGSYKFTKKSHPPKGIMAAVLGVIAVVSMLLSVYLSYLDGMNGETTKMQYGLAAGLAFLMALVGVVLGLLSNAERERYKFFPIVGLILNSAVLFGGVYILYAGI